MGYTVFAKGTTIYDPAKAWNCYVLFDGRSPKGNSFLIDMNGNVVKEYPYNGFPSEIIDPALVGGARGRALLQGEPSHFDNSTLIEVDWNDEIVWTFGPKAPGGRAYQNHDQARLPNGNTLVLCASHGPIVGAPYPHRDCIIYEVTPAGDIVWTWRTSEHLDECGLTKEAQAHYLGADCRPRASFLVINNMQPIGPNRWFKEGDTRFHPDNIMIDSRDGNFIVIIDRATGSVVWRMGPDYPGTHRANRQQNFQQLPHEVFRISGQHDAHIIPEGVPGAGNLLVFDNQAPGGYPPAWLDFYTASRVLEIEPRSQRIVWQYDASCSGRPLWSFYSGFMGSARRLPNGNTLICEAMNGRLFQVTPAGEIVWEYANPHVYADCPDHGVNIRNRESNWIYRAQPVPYDWVPEGTPRSEIAVDLR